MVECNLKSKDWQRKQTTKNEGGNRGAKEEKSGRAEEQYVLVAQATTREFEYY